MATTINADTIQGLKLTSDTSGEIKLQSAGADIVTVNNTGITLATGKNLTLSSTALDASASGIYLGGTTASHLLDDYEEGTWTPNVFAASGTITSYTVNQATYTKIGRLVNASFSITITNNGTGAAAVRFTLPFTPAVNAIGAGRENAATGFMLQILVSATSLNATIFNYANSYPAGTNYNLIGTVTYSI